jgi:hypothetical protein
LFLFSLAKVQKSLFDCSNVNSTWRGQRGEEWSSAQGLESVLISIQSLLSANPYENEPGFEAARTLDDRENMAHYIAKVGNRPDPAYQLRSSMQPVLFSDMPCSDIAVQEMLY